MGFNLQDSCTLNALALIAPAGTPGAIALTPAADGSARRRRELAEAPCRENRDDWGLQDRVVGFSCKICSIAV
jgi:hypothetical protein